MNKFILTVSWLFFSFFSIVAMTTLSHGVDTKKHPTCEQTTKRVLKPYIDRLMIAEKSLLEYEFKLAERIRKIGHFMTQLKQTRSDFDEAQKKDLTRRDTKIAYMLEAVDEIRQKIRADIAKLNQQAVKARAAGRESEANSYARSAQKQADMLSSGKASGHKRELGWGSTINGWKKQAKDTRDKRNKRAASWSAGKVSIHIGFLGYSISWSGVQQRLIKEREKLAAATGRKPGFHLHPLGYTLNGQGIDNLVKKRKKELKDARSRIAAGTFKLHIPIFGFTADRNYAQERMDKAKAKLQKDRDAWGKGTYKTHSRALGYTLTNGAIEKTIQKKKDNLAYFIAAGDKAKVHVPQMGYTTSGESIREQIQKAKTTKHRALWEQKYAYWREAITKAIEKKRIDIKKWEGYLAAFKKQWQKDLANQKKHIETTLTWALGETPCGGGITTSTSNKPPKLDDIPEFRDFRGLDDKRVSRENWEKWVKLHCRTLISSVNSYPGIHNKIVIPGETQEEIDKGLVRGFFSSGDLASLLAMDDLPAKNRSDNIYAAVTENTEQKLRMAILKAQPDSLLPWHVMRMSLDASDGSYPLAVLTAHAVLKTAAKLGRSDGQTPMFSRAGQNKWDEVEKLRKKLSPHSGIAKRLRNLRPKDDTTGDKLGPWYHAFGLLSAGALVSPLEAEIGARGEHWLKWFKAFGSEEGAYNREKETTDLIFANCASLLGKYNRFYTPATREQIERLLQDSIRRSSTK